MATKPYTGCVYLATNLLNGKLYVGKTMYGLGRRRAAHIAKAATGARQHFCRALRFYGEGAFAWEEIYLSDDDEALLAAEIQLIAILRADGLGLYNMTDGGNGAHGLFRTPEHSAKISAAQKGRKQSDEQKRRHSEFMTGRKLTEEHKAAISAGNKGRKPSPESVAKTTAFHRGRKRSEETRARISAALTGRPVKPETRAKISAFNLGKKMSPESIEKTRAAQTGRKKRRSTSGPCP